LYFRRWSVRHPDERIDIGIYFNPATILLEAQQTITCIKIRQCSTLANQYGTFPILDIHSEKIINSLLDIPLCVGMKLFICKTSSSFPVSEYHSIIISFSSNDHAEK
jgi:hypothetical protein